MTKEEAIVAMEAGHKVTHQYFTKDEFIRMKNGKLITEEGYEFEPWKFWMYRNYKVWETDWSIYKGK